MGAAPTTHAQGLVPRVGLNGAACGFDTIVDAINAATNNNTIYIPEGLYEEQLGIIDKDLTFTSATPDCTTEMDNPDESTIIDANSIYTGGGGVVGIDVNTSVTFRNIYLRNGNADLGGIIFVYPTASLVLDDSHVSHGVAADYGGGLYVDGTADLINGSTVFANTTGAVGIGGGAYVTINGTLTIYDNSGIGRCNVGFENTTPNNGGGVNVEGGILTLFDNAYICNNHADNEGGGIFANDGATITFNDNATLGGVTGLHGNTANSGAGIYLVDVGTILTMNSGTTIQFNVATTSAGGFYIDNGPAVHFIGATVRDNTAINGGCGGFCMLGSGAVIIDGSTFANNSALRGGGFRVFGSSTTVDIINGSKILNNVATNGNGGAGYIEFGQLNIVDSQLEGNTASDNGGAIYFENANIDISDTTGTTSISNNEATNGAGGAIYGMGSSDIVNIDAWGTSRSVAIDNNNAGTNGGGIYMLDAPLVITGNVIVSNNTATMHGGGIYLDGGDHRISDSFLLAELVKPLVVNNVAINGNGGGVYTVDVDDTLGTVAGSLFEGMSIVGNLATSGINGNGGGIFAQSSRFSMNNVWVHDNVAGGNGGGLYAGTDSSLNIFDTTPPATLQAENEQEFALIAEPCDPNTLPANTYCSEFRGNSTLDGTDGSGAGIYLQGISTLFIQNTAFLDNNGARGSAIYSLNDGAVIDVTNGLFSGNNGESTLRVFNNGNLTLNSSTFAGNTSTDTIAVPDGGANVSFLNNIVYANTGGVNVVPAIAGSCNISQNGVGGTNTDPLFTTTIRGDYRLGSGSPAIDLCLSGVSSDLDNVARPKNGLYDFGAFEFVCPALAVAPTVAITDMGNDVVLTWTADPNADEYRIYRDTSPYYVPDNGTLVQLGSLSPWTDSGVTGDAGLNYYYYLVVEDCADIAYNINHIAEFDFDIVPGL